MSNTYPAVVVVGYNRPQSLNRLLKSINEAIYPQNNIKLIVSIDRSDIWEKVKGVADNFDWKYGDKIVIVQERRLGLKKHIIKCGDLSYKYGTVIILEDDLIVAKDYYNYICACEIKYRDNKHVCGFALYSHAWNGFSALPFHPMRNGFDAYLGQFSITWGQAWTSKQWDGFKKWLLINDNKLEKNYKIPENIEFWGAQSWGKYFVYYIVENNLYYVVPYASLSSNCSEAGEHNKTTTAVYQTYLLDGVIQKYSLPYFKDAVKYDVFCERVLPESGRTSTGIAYTDICMNLNGLHRDSVNKLYTLTSKKNKNAEPVEKYGLELRPIEQNFVKEIKGEKLFLYRSDDLKGDYSKIASPSYARLEFEFHILPLKRAGFIFMNALLNKIKHVLKKEN